MKTAAILLALLGSAAAFVPTAPRALARTTVARPKTELMAVEVEDDVESSITRLGLIGGIGFPILAAPFAETFGPGGGIVIVGLTTAIWVAVFVQTLQKVGM